MAVIAATPLLRRRIIAALDFDRLPVVFQSEFDDSTVADAAHGPPRVVVLAGADGATLRAALDTVVRDLPETRTVLVDDQLQGGPLRRALRAGARGVIAAADIETGLALAVRAVSAGLVVVPEAMRERLEPPALSPRERQVLALAAEGSTTAEIARLLTISLGTVKRHLSSCFAKLGVENRSEALALLADAQRDPDLAGSP